MINIGRRGLLSIFAMLLFGFGATGCLTTIDEHCEEVARAHCANCFACADSLDDVSVAKLCDLPGEAAQSRGACESALEKQCGSQANAVQDPYKDLERCQDALDDATCTDLVERFALGQADAPQACLRFL